MAIPGLCATANRPQTGKYVSRAMPTEIEALNRPRLRFGFCTAPMQFHKFVHGGTPDGQGHGRTTVILRLQRRQRAVAPWSALMIQSTSWVRVMWARTCL